MSARPGPGELLPCAEALHRIRTTNQPTQDQLCCWLCDACKPESANVNMSLADKYRDRNRNLFFKTDCSTYLIRIMQAWQSALYAVFKNNICIFATTLLMRSVWAMFDSDIQLGKFVSEQDSNCTWL